MVRISSHGDSRLMQAMLIQTDIGLSNPNFESINNINIAGFYSNVLPVRNVSVKSVNS